MKKLNTSYATNDSQQPLKTTSVDFIQQGISDISLWLAKSLTELKNDLLPIGSTTYSISTPYVIQGLQNRSTSGTYSLDSGTVLYNNEMFYIATYSATNTNALIATYSYPSSSYDPTIFSDLVSHNVHIDKQISWIQGSTGSGLFNLSSLTYSTFTLNSMYNTLINMFDTQPWITLPTVSSPFSNSLGYGKYRIDGNGMVSLKGYLTVSIGAVSFGATICTLPLGYRPVVSSQFAVSATSVSSGMPLTIGVLDDGTVKLFTAFTAGVDQSISLDGIHFYID